MRSLREELTYFIGQQIKNPAIPVRHIAEKVGMSREDVNMYLFNNYGKFEEYIKMRKQR